MSGLVDANVIVRYLTNEPLDQAAKAQEILESAEMLYLTGMVVTEVGYVLTRLYSFPRVDVVDALLELVRRPNIEIVGVAKHLAIEALVLCRPSGRVSIADALLWATARSAALPHVVYTFDRRFPSDGIELRDTPDS